VSAGDSLIFGDVVELMLGGVVSAHPLCPGATIVLAPGFSRGAGVPRTLEISSLLLDGSTISGIHTDNRIFSLPVKISGATRAIVNGGVELLADIVDQQKFRLQLTSDPQGGTGLPLVFQCYRGSCEPQYDQDMEDQLVRYVALTFPAHPFGHSDTLTTLAFPAPAISWSSPPTPVRVDDYSTVSTSTNPADWSQSVQAVDDSFSARWSAAGASTNPVYTRTLGASVAITGLDRLSFNFGLGTSTYTTWHGGRVTFAITLTDNASHTLSFGGQADVAASNDPNFPNWQPVTFQIPASGVFSFANVTAYSIRAWRRVTWFATLEMDADVYLNGLTATASASSPIAAVRGTVYRIGAPGGTARTLMSAQFQPSAPLGGGLTTYTFTSAGPFTFVPSLGQTSGKVRVIGASGKGGSRTTTGVAGGAGGGATAGHDTYPMTPGQAISGVVGAAGGSGGFPTLAATYSAFQDSSNTLSLVTASFTPTASDVLVIKAIIGDGFSNFGSPSGGGLTWTSRVNIGPTGTSRVVLWTATVGGSPTAMTVTVPFSGVALPHGMVVERWTSAKLAGSPAVASASGSGSAPSATCTTVAAQSVVSWVNSDHNVGSGARAYRSSATEDGYRVVPGAFSTGYTGYWAWQQAAAAGAQTCGLTTPASQVWELAGVEIQALNTGALTDGGDSTFDGMVFNADGGKSVPDNTTTGGLGGLVANSAFPGGGFSVRGGNGFTAVTTGGGGGSSAGTDLVGVDAAGQAGATAPAGGGSGGGGGNAGGNNAGTAGSAPGGGGGGAVSTGGSTAGGAGQPGKVIVTAATPITPIKTLLVHAPGYNAPSTFSPLIPVGAGLDPPDGREYTVPSPVEGLNARFYGTYTILTFWQTLNTPSASRTHTCTFKQYDYTGGPSTSVSAVRTLTPTTESPPILNGYVALDTITLPARDIAEDQTTAYTTVSMLSTNASDRCLDVVAVDVTGQLLVFNHATGYPNIWWDPPETDRDWGRILGSSFDRAAAVSVLDSVANGALSGGPLIIDPDGPGWLLAYSPDAGAPALTSTFWAAWRDSRLS
jgi:hypothetical protein